MNDKRHYSDIHVIHLLLNITRYLYEHMAITEDNALNNLNKFIMANQQLQPSPDKIVNMEDVMQKVLQEMPMFGGLNVVPPIDIKPTSSTDSDTPRNVSPVSDGQQDISSSTANKEPRYFDEMLSSHIMKAYRLEPWYECFTTISRSEFDALIYSVYVMSRDDKKVDGYEYYECINRLQSKCRYRVRTKRMNEFYIVEEKGAHNHAMEPVGTPGSHAGLPKTLREIVDKSFNEEWSHSQRQEKLEEEVRRLGLPHNPRLGRQVDNRIAYLRRVKNLNEMKKMQDQAPSTAISSGLSMVSNPKQMEQLDSQLKCEPEPIDSHQMNVSNATDLLNMVMQATGGQMSNSNPEEQLKLLQLMMGGAPLDLQPNCGSDNDTDLEMDAGRVENAKNLFIEGENDDDDDDDDADDNGDDAEGAKGTASEINGSAMFGARDARVEIEERMDY